jgi:hypothetical protein
MDKIDISEIVFVKTKSSVNYKQQQNGNYKKNFLILDKENKKIIFDINNIRSPFGIENYNNQKILNIIIDPNKYNQHHNLFVNLNKLEANFNDQNFNDKNIDIDIKDKKYYSLLKYNPNNNNYILRTHIIGIPNIYTTINNKKFIVSEDDIKNKNLNAKLEIASMWVTDDQFGFLFYIKEIYF